MWFDARWAGAAVGMLGAVVIPAIVVLVRLAITHNSHSEAIQRHEERIARLEANESASRDDLAEMRSDIAWIKQTLSELKDALFRIRR
jgi:septal ring factor EnvC (AmiA/AmiB activator)